MVAVRAVAKAVVTVEAMVEVARAEVVMRVVAMVVEATEVAVEARAGKGRREEAVAAWEAMEAMEATEATEEVAGRLVAAVVAAAVRASAVCWGLAMAAAAMVAVRVKVAVVLDSVGEGAAGYRLYPRRIGHRTHRNLSQSRTCCTRHQVHHRRSPRHRCNSASMRATEAEWVWRRGG